MAVYTTVDDPSIYQSTLLYTGDGATDRTVTGVGFQPDLGWFWTRNATQSKHVYDAVRGETGGDYYYLVSNSTDAQTTASDSLHALAADGYTMDGSAAINGSGTTMAVWSWKAGTTSGISGGTITPSAYSINTASGFGIYTYTGNDTAGATIAHGLGAIPEFIVVKKSDGTGSWQVYHGANTTAPETDYLLLDDMAATADALDRWNDTAPTTTLFSLGDATEVNDSGNTYVAYVWAGVQGYSRFSTYKGNGSSHGAMINCGFRPAWIMVKKTSGTDSWIIFNNKLQGFNPDNDYGYADAITTVGTSDYIYIMSNGFWMTNTTTLLNEADSTYVYAAFAEQPFANSNGVAATAR
jgi:hypothetical protein